MFFLANILFNYKVSQGCMCNIEDYYVYKFLFEKVEMIR